MLILMLFEVHLIECIIAGLNCGARRSPLIYKVSLFEVSAIAGPEASWAVSDSINLMS